MAPNADPTCRAIARFIARRLDLPVEVVDGVPWQERERLLDAGDIHLCWLCGWPYVVKADRDEAFLELAAAPVMQAPRYRERPVYFSDVVVHHDSDYHRFGDLRGSTWAYNEPHSHSGHNVVLHHLAQLGETAGFFRSATESGTHQESLRMILDHEIDASAIDSTVLEAELRQRPELKDEIRVVETLGPSPMPPWVVVKSLSVQLRMGIEGALLTMHFDGEGAAALRQWGISHFVPIENHDYDPIRRMADAAEGIRLTAG